MASLLSDRQLRREHLEFRAKGNSGKFFDWKSHDLLFYGAGTGYYGPPDHDGWSLYTDRKLFRKTVKLSYVLEVFNKITPETKEVFLAQFLTHDSVPAEVKNQLVSRVVFKYGKKHGDEFLPLFQFKMIDHTPGATAEPDVQNVWRKKIIGYVFGNININDLEPEALWFASKRTHPEDQKLVAEAVAKNPTLKDEENFRHVYDYLNTSMLQSFLDALPNSQETLDFLYQIKKLFGTVTDAQWQETNVKTSDRVTVLINQNLQLFAQKVQKCNPDFADLPVTWVQRIIFADIPEEETS